MTAHLLDKFAYCPQCGSRNFEINDMKSKRCSTCGLVYYLNPSAANVAFILNEKGELLVERRAKEPKKGTLDLPGGFTDAYETGEEAIKREVKEETNLEVISTKYLFSLPNQYLFSGINIPTLDMFFMCKVKNTIELKAQDDAGEVMWVALKDIDTNRFGLQSIRKGLQIFLKKYTDLSK